MSNYDLHQENIKPQVWNNQEGMERYIKDLQYDYKLTEGLEECHNACGILLEDAMKRLEELKVKPPTLPFV